MGGCMAGVGNSATAARSMLPLHRQLGFRLRPTCSAALNAGERPGIVVLTIGLEESLPKLPGPVIPSKLWSPYRLPLVRFLTQYPVERQALGSWGDGLAGGQACA